MTLPKILFSIALMIIVDACTLYKSEDRDSFNQNAKAGAPNTLLAAPSAIVRDTGAESCWVAPTSESSVFVDDARHIVTVHEGTLLCLFSSQTYSVESRAQVERNSTRLNEF